MDYKITAPSDQVRDFLFSLLQSKKFKLTGIRTREIKGLAFNTEFRQCYFSWTPNSIIAGEGKEVSLEEFTKILLNES